MVGDLADGYRGIAMLSEKTGETGMLDVVGSRKESTVTGRTIGTGEQGVAGCPAGGCLHVMPMEGPAQRGQFVDVR